MEIIRLRDYSVYENVYFYRFKSDENANRKIEYLSGAAFILPSFALTSTCTSTSTTQTRTKCSQLAVGLLTAVGLFTAVGLLTAVSLLTTSRTLLILEMRLIADLSACQDVLATDLMRSTYFFVSTNALAAVAWCAGFPTGFPTGAMV